MSHRHSPQLVFDVTRLAARLLEGRHPTGVDRVSLAYLGHWRAQARCLVRHWGRWAVMDRADSQLLLAALLGDAAQPRRVVRSCVARGLLRRWDAPRGSVLFNTGHSGLDDPRYAERVAARGLCPVYFLHDLIPLTHPEYCRAGEAQRHGVRLRTMLSHGAGLVLNSRATLQDLQREAERQRWALPPHVVLPLGTQALPEPEAARPLEAPYFVMLGTVEPRKNHLLLLQLWRELALELGDAVPRLVLLGQRGWECEQVVDMLERCEALKGKVLELGAITDRQLSTWLHHARALLFPSFVEGFGMPLAEALAHGVPVVASDLPAFREISSSVPDYLQPLDGPAWRRMVLDFARADSPMRAAQLERMQGFRAPSWEQHFTGLRESLQAWNMLPAAAGAQPVHAA
jgi:glycosyltransferase involved in cell wall biosynthesis